jgi:hypothetical protein
MSEAVPTTIMQRWSLVSIEAPRPRRSDSPMQLKVEIMLEWLDENGDVVTTGRGSFEVQGVRVTRRRSPLEGDVVVDTAILRGQMAHRPVIISEVDIGDRFSVRFASLSPPSGATQARVLFRELP